ncbi:hypothetical protein M8R20_05170 [Pseudomonas sp. R2.Fl]|nr:hypothetical protein [Pseudomonas sp. R2.Fl]
MIPLSAIRDSFGGVIPSLVATADTYGMPSICYLSHVYYVDDRHVALTNPRFSQTAANEFAAVMVVDGFTGQQHLLDLSFDRSETGGEIFADVMRHLARLEQDVMLGAIDIYHVEDCRAAPAAHAPEPPPVNRPVGAAIPRSRRN